MTTESVVVAAARTPIGKLSGALRSFSAVELGAIAIAEALRRSNVRPEDVDSVIMGQVLQAGQGQNPARQAASGAGIPPRVPAMTINKVCLSGIQAVHLADLMIRAGEAEIVVAGGMESMTGAPYLLANGRNGYRFGNGEVLDTIQVDGLTCAFENLGMGDATDRYAARAEISRERQDGVAALSHQRAASATSSGKFAKEIVTVPGAKPDDKTFQADQGVRPETTEDVLAKLKPAFSATGTITAGNASQISDGAAALVITSASRALALGIEPLARLVGYGQVAGPDPSLLTQPSRAVRAALQRSNLSLSDIDLFEINEAFGAVAVASMDDLGINSETVNVNGGSIALGHPIGMTGARLLITLAYELRRRGGGIGAATLCGGGGQGDAALIRVG